MEKKNLGLQVRNLTIKADDVTEDTRTVELSFSSEEPYERGWGIEILGHKDDQADLSFLGSGNAPLLVGHNHDDPVGVIEKAWLQDGVGRARVRFGTSDRAEEIFQDVSGGIRRNVSVGYHIKTMTLMEKADDGPDKYLVDNWYPVEASIVSVPADTTVGFRAADSDIETEIRGGEAPKEDIKMEEKKEVVTEQPRVDMDAIRAAEMARQADIRMYGIKSDMQEEAEKAIRSNDTVDSFRAKAFDKMIEKHAKPAVDLDSFSDKDREDMSGYSFVKALHEAGEKNLSGLEKEMHEEGQKQLRATGVTTTGNLSIPYQILAQRDLTAGTTTAGGHTIATDLLASSFIELLQNRMKVKEMGATVLDNLTGNIAIPSQATGATAAWEGENDAGAESSPTFGQVALSPNRVGTYTELSKQLLVQSSVSVDNVVKNLLADSIALAIDLAALHGTGSSNQPTGIAATSGIGSVAGGTNGLAPAYSHIIELETDVATANADVGRMGYLSNAKVRGKLKQVFTNATYGDIPIWNNGMMNGYKAEVSNQVSSTLVKGTSGAACSAIFFGNWADLVLAFWGGLDVVVDPFSLATTNLTRITANTYADVGVRHAASFSAMLDALTA